MTILANLFFTSLYACQTAAMMAGIATVCVGEWIGIGVGQKRYNPPPERTGPARITRRYERSAYSLDEQDQP